VASSRRRAGMPLCAAVLDTGTPRQSLDKTIAKSQEQRFAIRNTLSVLERADRVDIAR
jgi:hypothetical protein